MPTSSKAFPDPPTLGLDTTGHHPFVPYPYAMRSQGNSTGLILCTGPKGASGILSWKGFKLKWASPWTQLKLNGLLWSLWSFLWMSEQAPRSWVEWFLCDHMFPGDRCCCHNSLCREINLSPSNAEGRAWNNSQGEYLCPRMVFSSLPTLMAAVSQPRMVVWVGVGLVPRKEKPSGTRNSRHWQTD